MSGIVDVAAVAAVGAGAEAARHRLARGEPCPTGWAQTWQPILTDSRLPDSRLPDDPGEPFVLLDDACDTAPALLFRAPRQTVVATSADDLRPALEAIRDGVRAGFHAAGYLAYEAGLALEPRLAALCPPGGEEPLLWFGLFDAPTALLLPSPSSAPHAPRRLAAKRSRSAYLQSVTDILALIEAGDCYQVNFTQEGLLEDDAPALERYLALRCAQKAGWGGMLSTGTVELQSFSPEMFFSLRDGQVWTRPMKGTAPRGLHPEADATQRESLRADPKERAENLMIVDLLRNDLSRIAVPGTVRVDDLFAIESYPTVHQMTSSITARLHAGLDAVDILLRLFPCGSITGAPKIRAMEIIAAQERRSRGAYTGSMGYIAPDGSAAFNVLIRTLERRVGSPCSRFGVGSGIVSDSRPPAEWDECQTKAAFLNARHGTGPT